MQEKCNVKKDPKILLACGLEWPRVNYFKWEKPYRHSMTASDLGQNTIKPHNNNTLATSHNTQVLPLLFLHKQAAFTLRPFPPQDLSPGTRDFGAVLGVFPP